MLGEDGIAAFEAAPVGREVRGEGHACWCVDDRLCVTSIWGRPSAGEAAELTRLCEVAFHRDMAAPFDTVIDMRWLAGVDHEPFAVFSEYVRRRGLALRRVVRRQAIVRPEGMLGALVAGFCGVFGLAYPARVFTELGEALVWLGRPDARGLAAEIDARVAEQRILRESVTVLRALLDKDARAPSLNEAARALACSSRTLQRDLADARTSFRAEVDAARVRRAQRLLVETNRDVTSIAFEVGCSSLQHLGTTFRRVTGLSPTAWRERRSA